jgi:RNA-binding protein Luc7-like 2
MEATRKKLLDQSEMLGEQGKLEESEHKAVEAENIKKAREELLLAHEASSNPFKTFKICEICGAR